MVNTSFTIFCISVFFAPVFVLLIVLIAGDNYARSHISRALVSLLIPALLYFCFNLHYLQIKLPDVTFFQGGALIEKKLLKVGLVPLTVLTFSFSSLVEAE